MIHNCLHLVCEPVCEMSMSMRKSEKAEGQHGSANNKQDYAMIYEYYYCHGPVEV